MTVFTKEEVTKSCLEFFGGDQLATKVWMNKYCLKNQVGEFVEKSPIDRYKAIAKAVYEVDVKHGDVEFTEEEYYEALVNQELSPGGSGLYGIANPYSITSLGNCFVIDGNNEDSYGSILKIDQEIVQIAKRRGGVGTDVSHLRPKAAFVSNSAGTSSGVVSFCERYSNSSREVAQDGRRGALMLSISVLHPDVMEFISMKTDTGKVTGANVSVRLNDQFMHAVESDGYYTQKYPVTADVYSIPESSLPTDGSLGRFNINGKTVYARRVKARTVWNAIIKANWKSAEPGALFWDTILRESVADCYPKFRTVSTNPCGEIPLSPYDSCRLLSVNLVKCVDDMFTPQASFNREKFERLSRMAMRMMDNIIDLEIEKITQIEDKIKADPESIDTKWAELDMWSQIRVNTIDGRRSGISIIGHGDMLAMLGFTYGTKNAKIILETIHEKFAREIYAASQKLAKTRGAFPAFNARLEAGNPFLNRIGAAGIPRRNIALLTIPPVGTMSLIMNNQTSGCEPVFMPVYKRSRKVNPNDKNVKVDFVDEVGDSWEEFYVFHPYFRIWAEINYPDVDLNTLTEEGINELVSKSPYAGATAMDINPLDKIELIGALQKWIDHSISNTTNLPANVSEKTVSDLYLKAWAVGCKGITIYRDGSRTGVLNAVGSSSATKFEQRDAPKRPKDLKCDIFYPTISGEKFIVMVGLLEGKPYEAMALKKGDYSFSTKIESGILRKVKSGVYNLLDSNGNLLIEDITAKFEIPEWEFVTRLISTALRHGAAIQFVVEQLNKSEGSVVHISKVIARQLKRYIPEDSGPSVCPNCGTEMHMEGGCKQCKECGYGACG